MGIGALGIAGSLGDGSYNRGLLPGAAELTPNGRDVRILDNATFNAIPLCNEDVRARGT